MKYNLLVSAILVAMMLIGSSACIVPPGAQPVSQTG
jgi:hypothetical protein